MRNSNNANGDVNIRYEKKQDIQMMCLFIRIISQHLTSRF